MYTKNPECVRTILISIITYDSLVLSAAHCTHTAVAAVPTTTWTFNISIYFYSRSHVRVNLYWIWYCCIAPTFLIRRRLIQSFYAFFHSSSVFDFHIHSIADGVRAPKCCYLSPNPGTFLCSSIDRQPYRISHQAFLVLNCTRNTKLLKNVDVWPKTNKMKIKIVFAPMEFGWGERSLTENFNVNSIPFLEIEIPCTMWTLAASYLCVHNSNRRVQFTMAYRFHQTMGTMKL